MTYINYRSSKGYVTVQHSPGEGPPDSATERCPDEETFERFMAIREVLRREGRRVPSIRETFPEAYEGFDDRSWAADRPTQAAKQKVEEYTLEEYLGTGEKRGPFFTHSASYRGEPQVGNPVARTYVGCLGRYGAHMRGLPLSNVTEDDARRYVANLMVCRACVARARAAGRSDLLGRPDLHLQGTNPPWDGSCENEDGESTHYVGLARKTARGYLRSMKFLFRIAAWAGTGTRPRDSRCATVKANPFDGLTLEHYEERDRPHQHAFALSHAEVRCVAEAMPEAYVAAVVVATYGMFRIGELLGLSRGNVRFPAEGETHANASIKLTHTFGDEGLVPRGKTERAIGSSVLLPDFATSVLREHLTKYRSSPDPDTCGACREGIGEHTDERTKNPHRGCDLADDAPVWVDHITGARPPSNLFRMIFREAVDIAGLGGGRYVPTPHTLRASGATLRLESGESEASVQKQGRWSNLKTIMDHYMRPTTAGRVAANRRLDVQAKAAWGIMEGAADTPEQEVARLQLIVDHQMTELARLRERVSNPAGRERTDRDNRRRCTYGADEIREVAAGATSMREVFHRLGITPGSNSLVRIRRIARQYGIQLPPT